MTQGELEKIPQPFVKHVSDLEERIMEDVVRRIKENGFSSASADWQITRIQQLGESEDEIRRYIREALSATEADMDKIFSDTVYREYYGNDRVYSLSGMQQVPFEQNQELQQLIQAVREQTSGTFQNMTASMGFARLDPSGKMQYDTLQQFYQGALDTAIMDIQSGAFDYNTVLSRTIETMTKSGVRWIDYDTGHRDRVDVAARRAVLTGFRQIQGRINEQVARELGTDSYEVTYHVGARPTHQPWQGRVWTYHELETVCGLGSITGLHGANCYHDYNAFIPGVSVRTYTDSQLENMIHEENTPKEYNGKEYTTYEALQKQRQMERAMRKTRQDINLLQKGGGDADQITLKRARYQGQMQTYKDFSKKLKLPEQMDRVYQDGLRVPVGAAKAVVKSGKGGILKETTDKWSKEAKRELLQDERALSARQKETAVIYGPDGKVLFQKRGGESEVAFTSREIKRMKDGVVSHNHPTGGSFSTADIFLLSESGAAEIRAATENGVYYLRRPEKWPKEINSAEKIQKAKDEIAKDVRKKYGQMYREGKITKTERFWMASDETNKRFAERFGLTYGKEAFED